MEEFWDFILFLLMIVYSIFYLFEKFTKPNKPTNSLTVDDLPIPKKRFVELVLSWCHQNLGKPKHGYHLQIYYYVNKKWGGLYSFKNKQIIIYIPKGLTLTDLTNIVIHEYVHYLQLIKPADDAMYHKHTNEIGYWNNPYEVEARELSLKHQDKCMEWVMGRIS
jgi:hypothetical protein